MDLGEDVSDEPVSTVVELEEEEGDDEQAQTPEKSLRELLGETAK